MKKDDRYPFEAVYIYAVPAMQDELLPIAGTTRKEVLKNANNRSKAPKSLQTIRVRGNGPVVWHRTNWTRAADTYLPS